MDDLAPKTTTPFLTRFECARVLGLRELQLTETEGVEDRRATAIREVLEGKNPAVLRRYLPDGSHEDVAVAKLRLSRELLRFQLSI